MLQSPYCIDSTYHKSNLLKDTLDHLSN